MVEGPDVLAGAPSEAVLVVEVEDRHETPPWHPERPARLRAVRAGVADVRDGAPIVAVVARPATRVELAAVHDVAYLDALTELGSRGGGQLDPDTSMSPGSYGTALLGAGAGLTAMEALRAGRGAAAFVNARPPGHHAGRARAMGFCLLNNVAVTAAALRDAGERVAIIDWDAHHGNGTQDLFWSDPSVLYASIHEWPAYPGTGRATEVGAGDGRGGTVNVPLPAGATGDVALAALERVIGPVVERFDPTWVLVSAGFDAHADDPIMGLRWSSGDFTRLTSVVRSWAPGPGRLIAFLEGGYDLDALRRSTTATLSALAGAPVMPEPATSGGPGMRTVDEAGSAWRTALRTR